MEGWYGSDPCPGNSNFVDVDGILGNALVTTIKDHFAPSRSVTIQSDLNETLYIFTDGAFEPTHEQPAPVGGILVNPRGQKVSYFGAFLPESLLNELIRRPYIRTRDFSSSHCRQVVGQSSSWYAFALIGRKLVETYVDFEYECRISPWFARVASHSNLADDPSRMQIFLHRGTRHKDRPDPTSPLESMGYLQMR